MRNAYIIIHQIQIGNIKIVCNLKASPEGIAHPKLLLKVNFENSSIQKGYKSIILNKKGRRGSQESIELKRILWNFVSWSAPQIFDQNFEFWILRIKEVPFEHEIILFSFLCTQFQHSGNYHMQVKLVSQPVISKAPQQMHIHLSLLRYRFCSKAVLVQNLQQR